MPRYQLQVTDELDTRLTLLCAQYGISKNDLIRNAINLYTTLKPYADSVYVKTRPTSEKVVASVKRVEVP